MQMPVGPSTARPRSTGWRGRGSAGVGVGGGGRLSGGTGKAAGIRLGRHLGKNLQEKSRVSKEEAVFTVNWTEN